MSLKDEHVDPQLDKSHTMTDDDSTTKCDPLPLHSPDVVAGSEDAELADDHPEGDAIRRQVEFYFSDENLVTDKHMLEKMNYNDNLPVSINHILGFRKMRRFKKRALIVKALKKSAFLDVTDDKKLIRKVPFKYEPPTESEQLKPKIIVEGGRPVLVKPTTLPPPSTLTKPQPALSKKAVSSTRTITYVKTLNFHRERPQVLRSSTPRRRLRLLNLRKNKACIIRT
jgi:hypothetical protein